MLMLSTKQPDSGENDKGQDLQREGTKQQDSLLGNESNQSEGPSGSAQLPTRKRLYLWWNIRKALHFLLFRSIGARRSFVAGGEVLDTVALEQLLRNLQRHEDSWPFVRWSFFRYCVSWRTITVLKSVGALSYLWLLVLVFHITGVRPVNPVSAPDYHLVVKNPTNLEKIRRQLDEMRTYINNRQVSIKMISNCECCVLSVLSCEHNLLSSIGAKVLLDIQLVFDNCRLYNQPGINEIVLYCKVKSTFMSWKYVLFQDAEEFECAERLERYFCEMKKELGLSHCLLDGAEWTFVCSSLIGSDNFK